MGKKFREDRVRPFRRRDLSQKLVEQPNDDFDRLRFRGKFRIDLRQGHRAGMVEDQLSQGEHGVCHGRMEFQGRQIITGRVCIVSHLLPRPTQHGMQHRIAG